MTDNNQSQPDDALEELGERLKRGRKDAGLDPVDEPNSTKAAGEGFRIAIEFVVSIFVGAGLGFLIGKWAGDQNIGLVIGFFVGFAAGMRAIWRELKKNAEAQE